MHVTIIDSQFLNSFSLQYKNASLFRRFEKGAVTSKLSHRIRIFVELVKRIGWQELFPQKKTQSCVDKAETVWYTTSVDLRPNIWSVDLCFPPGSAVLYTAENYHFSMERGRCHHCQACCGYANYGKLNQPLQMLFLVPFYAALSSFVLTITLYLGMNRKLLCLKDLFLCRSGRLMWLTVCVFCCCQCFFG